MSLGIKKGDKVVVLSGKDKGKTGKVLEVIASGNSAIIDGINLAKKHLRRRSESESGGIKEMPRPLAFSKLALFCSSCGKGARFGIKILADNTKTRICKRCQQAI
jgi:large subunit ribosomal protein L24